MLKSKNILRPLIVTILILLVPVFGMRFLSGWDWSASDFLLMGILIFGTGLLVEFANKKIKNRNHRIVVIAAIVLALLVLWAHLAVGIVDSWPLAGS